MKKLFVLILGVALLAPMASFAAPATVVVENNASDSVDDMLTELDKAVTEFISVAKKAMNGDMDAFEKMEAYQEKIDSLVEALEEVEDDMSESQIERAEAIMMKAYEAFE